METADAEIARRAPPILEHKAGRILVNGGPTGVEVAPAMVPDGAVPSSFDRRTTSVGSLANSGFLRPVGYPDLPADLLPEELRDVNRARPPRLLDGGRTGTIY
jgi:2,5-dioxopentanoate dehydrogenase